MDQPNPLHESTTRQGVGLGHGLGVRVKSSVNLGLFLGLLLIITFFAVPAVYITAAHGVLAHLGGGYSERTAAVTRATEYLSIAKQWSPSDPTIYRALAQANAQLGKMDATIDALEQAVRLMPTSLVIQIDLAQAYMLADRITEANLIWKSLGVNPTRLSLHAQMFFASKDYHDALIWYQLAAQYATEDDYSRIWFMQLLSAVYANEITDSLKKSSRASGVLTSVGVDGVLIKGSSLRWLINMPGYGVIYGTPLNVMGNSKVGTFWWNGESVALVDIPSSGLYQIDVGLCNCAPPPIEMRLGVDGQVLSNITLTRGDSSLSQSTVRVNLKPGIHVIQLWFDNNAIVNGVDRNAAVSWVAIRSDPTNAGSWWSIRKAFTLKNYQIRI